MTKKKMVIFASGRGSNAIALHDAVEAGTINAEIKALVCDIPGAPVMDRAKEWGVPVILADRKSFDSKAAFEKYILDAIEPYQADIICLAGFMRLLSGDFISHYEHKMLNIHPALLPSFRGLHAQRQAVSRLLAARSISSFPTWMPARSSCSQPYRSTKTIRKTRWQPGSSPRNIRLMSERQRSFAMIN